MLVSLPVSKRPLSPRRPDARPVITLLTDFGDADPYVGVMKGVIAGICPVAQVVDLCHAIEPYAIAQAGFLLACSFRYFPAGSVHVAVVDPGVGSSRRGLVVEALGHRFVGPDNGLFSMIFREAAAQAAKSNVAGSSREKAYAVREIQDARWMLAVQSQTFHGRDVFAPAAAHLAAGRRFGTAGPEVGDALRQDWDLPVRTGKRFWNGSVMHADRFGNLITNLRVEDFALEKDNFELQAGAAIISMVYGCYEDAKRGELFLISGSSGYWEISTQQGSARERLGLVPGSPVELVRLR